MADLFAASYLKIDRAKRHLAEPERITEAWLAINPVTATSKIEGTRIGVSGTTWGRNLTTMDDLSPTGMG
jgi:hypothetical protein